MNQRTYALVIDIGNTDDPDEHASAVGFLQTVQELIQGWTPYESYLDLDYNKEQQS